MAETVEDFYVRLGLSLSELESGFVEANRTIAANIGRLNRESNLIRLRTEVELSGLDEAADAEEIMRIKTNALNRLMALQRDRIRLVQAELRNLTAEYGENAAVTQQAATRLERARLALANMEREMRNLSQPQEETNSGLSDLSGILDRMPPQLKAVAAGIGAVASSAGMAGKSVEALLEDFRELQTQAYELNMSVGKTRDFLMKLRLGGGDIGDIEGYIRGITDAFVKGEVDDPEFIALDKYGAKITDATGRLKDFKDITEEVYQAWKKADEAGEGIEFLQLTGGESGIRDAIQFFKRYEEAVADAQKIMKAGIDESQLHELDRTMKLCEEQAGELKNALGDIFVPAAQTAAESFFETLHKGTELLTENKDEIQRWGFIAKEAFSTAGEKISGAFEAAGKKISEINKMLSGKTGDSRVDKILGDMSWRYGGTQPAFGIDKMISGQVDGAKKSYGVLNDVVKRGEAAQAAYNAKVAETSELWQKVFKVASGGNKNPLSQYAAKRVQQFKDELADLRIELDFDDEIEQAKARLQLWFDREHNRKLFLSDEEKSAITDLYSAKMEQLNEERKQIIEKAQEELTASMQTLYQTDLENRLAQIEKERQAWIDKCGDEVKATKLAEQQKADAQRNAAMSVIRQQAKEYEAYQKGGLAGLQAYKVADLARSGVNLDYLKMTPQQLQQFQQANQLAEKGLMPNFMTDTDKAMYQQQLQQSYQQRQKEFDDENYAIVNGIKTTMSEALGGVPITLKLDDNSVLNLSPAGQRATMRDYETDNNGRLQSMTERSFELPSIVSEVAQSFSEMPSIIQSASESLRDLPITVQGISETLSSIQITDMNQPLEEVTVRLNDLSAALESLTLPNKNGQQSEERKPVNVSVTVQIEEAHAWDSQHIQELADKVADEIQPEIVRAIGGDSNSY